MTVTETDPLAALPLEVRERLAPLLPVLQQAVDAAVEADPMRPMVLRGEAVVLQQQAGELYDEADRLERDAALATAVAEAESALAAAETEASRLADVVRQATVEERDAADRCAAAQDHARLMAEEAEDLAREGADPSQQTEAILKRNAAEQVAGTFRVKAERAAAERVAAEASLATARAAARRAKTALTAAERVADNPPPLMPGPFTLLLDGVRRFAFGQTSGWSQEHTDQVAGTVEELAVMLGLDKVFAARARKEIEGEAARKVSTAFLPKPGHPTRPSDAGTVFMPVPGRLG